MTDSLGKIAWSFVVDDEEKQRLRIELQKDDGAGGVFRRYATRAPNFDATSRSLARKVRGFRPGTGPYRQRARKIMLRDLINNRAPDVGWTIYRHAVALWCETQLPSLNRLMQEVTAPNAVEPGDSSELLRLMCDAAHEYEITDREIRKFYDYWPMPRVPHLEDILKNSPQYDPVKDLRGDVDALREELQSVHGELMESLAALEEQIEDSVRDSSDYFQTSLRKWTDDHWLKEQRKLKDWVTSKLHNVDQSLEKQLQTRVSEVATDTNRDDAELKTLILNLINEEWPRQQSSLIRSFDERISSFENDLQQHVDRSEVELRKEINTRATAIGGTVDSMRSSVDQAIAASSDSAEALKQKLSSLEDTCHQTTARLDELEDSLRLLRGGREGPNPVRNVFQLLRPCESPEKDEGASSHLALEGSFINRFTNQLNATGHTYTSQEAQLAHSLLLASPVVVCKTGGVAEVWFRCLGWWCDALHLAASSTWATPEDWETGVSYLFARSTPPNLVVIHDFDRGIYESYLFPVLTVASVHGSWGFDRRLLLIGDTNWTDAQPSSPILQLDHLMQSATSTVPANPAAPDRGGDIAARVLASWANACHEVACTNALTRTRSQLLEQIVATGLPATVRLQQIIELATGALVRCGLEPDNHSQALVTALGLNP